jgi:hypothetical protein
MPDICHHVYAGGKDGGVRGKKCARPESEHCAGACDRGAPSDHALNDRCAGVHHMFMRRPITGTYRVSSRTAVFGVIVLDGVVNSAPPMAKWAVGQPWEVMRQWCAKKGMRTERVRDVEP